VSQASASVAAEAHGNTAPACGMGMNWPNLYLLELIRRSLVPAKQVLFPRLALIMLPGAGPRSIF